MGYLQMSRFFLSFMAWVLLLSPAAAAADHGGTSHSDGSIAVIVDYGSRVGKEEKVAMELAIDDFYNKTNQRLVLHSRDSQGDPLRARLSAMDLIEKQQVQAIVGLHTWEEVSLVAEVGGQARIPILSLADSTPKWATDRWPFLVQASPSRYLQMNAVAAIVGSWQWRWITVIYEDTDSAATDIIPCLADALKQVGSEIGYLLALPPFTVNSSSPLSGELEGLKGRQSRVFVLHSSLSMAAHLFETANGLGMMEEGYVWIITDRTTNLIHSMNSAIISSMQGILGVRSYFSQSGPRFQGFYLRFREKFHSLYPKEDNHEPGIFALQAYDAVWCVALAMEAASSSQKGLIQPLLERRALTDFHGLTSRIQFYRRSLAPLQTFQIINVIGKSYRELGLWFKGFGFSKTTNEKAKYGRQLRFLGQVLWPGYPWSVPRGWCLPTSQKPLRIGVPQRGTFKHFVNVTYDESHYSVTGFSIEVFNATLEHLGYPLTYELILNNGSYDSLVEQVHLKKCLEVEADDDRSISPDSLWVLFLATGATSTVSLAIYVARQKQHFQDFMFEHSHLEADICSNEILDTSPCTKNTILCWRHQKNQFSSRVRNVQRKPRKCLRQKGFTRTLQTYRAMASYGLWKFFLLS